MKILILCNYFQSYNRFFPKILRQFLEYYFALKLESLIKKLYRRYNQNLSIELINASDDSSAINIKIETKSLSKLRLNMNSNNFLKIKEKTIRKTKQVLTYLYRNLIQNNMFSYKGIFFPKLLEFQLSQFLNEVFGNYEVLKQIFLDKKFDKLILFNCNKYILDFIKSFPIDSKNIILSQQKLFLENNKLLSLISTINSILIAIGIFVKKLLLKNTNRSVFLKKGAKKNILFYANSKNQIYSVKPIYKALKEYPSINPIYYSSQTYLSPKNLIKIIRFIFWVKNLLNNNIKEITKNIYFDSINLKNLFKIFYFNRFITDIIILFNVLNNFIDFIKVSQPDLVIITNDFLPSMRLIANYLKLKDIPSLFIPHAAIPVIDEMVTKNDIKYFALGGEYDKEYYIKKGIIDNSIKITGIPRYEYFYKNEIENLEKIVDLFNDKRYHFDKDKFTILLTTNPIDDESNEKILTTVIACLEELDLIGNLIIKLHPREDGIIHNEIRKKLGVEPIIVKDYKILDLIKSSDVLLSQKSTTILESMLVGTPAVLLDFVNKNFKETSSYLFLDEKFVKIVRDKQSLIQVIKNLYSNKDLREKYSKKLLKNTEKFILFDSANPPIKKITDFILELIMK